MLGVVVTKWLRQLSQSHVVAAIPALALGLILHHVVAFSCTWSSLLELENQEFEQVI